MLAMVVNDYACLLDKRSVLKSIASMLTPATPAYWPKNMTRLRNT